MSSGQTVLTHWKYGFLLMVIAGIALLPIAKATVQVNLATVALLRYWFAKNSPESVDQLVPALERLRIVDQFYPGRLSAQRERLEILVEDQRQAAFQEYFAVQNLLKKAASGEAESIGELQSTIGIGDYAPAELIVSKLALASASLAGGDRAGAKQYFTEALSTLPSPDNSIDCEDWVLEGVAVSDMAIEHGLDVPVILSWSREGSSTDSEFLSVTRNALLDDTWQTWMSRNQMLQVGITPNLIGDGGFEIAPAPHTGLVPQLAYPQYAEQPSDGASRIYEESSGSPNLVFQLDGQGMGPVGARSPVIRLSDQGIPAALLLTGIYRSSNDADISIGFRWTTKADPVPAYSFPVKSPSSNWRSFAYLVPVPGDIEGLSLWVLNRSEAGTLMVDQLGVFGIPLLCPSGFYSQTE